MGLLQDLPQAGRVRGLDRRRRPRPDRGHTSVVLGATDGAPLDVPALAEAVRAGTMSGSTTPRRRSPHRGAAFDDYGTQIHAVALSRAIKGASAS